MGSKFITGGVGVGKTTLAKKILEESRANYNEIKHKYHEMLKVDDLYKFYLIPELLLRARIPTKALEIVQEASRAHVIVLDDLGVNKLSNYSPDVVYIIINNRLERGRDTIVTSNLNLEQISELIDDRLASRLSSFEQILITGKDLRQDK